MDSKVGRIYLGHPGVDRHHLMIQDSDFFFPSSLFHTLMLSSHQSTQFKWFLMHSCWASNDPCNLCSSSHSCQAYIDSHNLGGSSWPDTPSQPLTPSLPAPSCRHTVIIWVWRWTSSQRSSDLRYALGGHSHASWEMHSKTAIERRCKCNCRQWVSKVGDAVGSHVRARFVNHSDAPMKLVWRINRRPWSSKIGAVLVGGGSRAESLSIG